MSTLKSSGFAKEEQGQIVTDLLALNKTQIRSFLKRHRLPMSGTKENIRSRIEDALQDERLTLTHLVEFLDEVVPWGKQHVYLYKGPAQPDANWQKADWVAKRLQQQGLGPIFNSKIALALPKVMTLSTVMHDGKRLRIVGITKRIWWERSEEYDESKRTEAGEAIELHAFVRRVTRGLVAFEWNLKANIAFLQISQLPSGFKYEEVAKEFFGLIRKWLDSKTFEVVDLRPVIRKLHELEENGTGETVSHVFNYRTLAGRQFEAKSASAADPLLGEAVTDAALSAIRKSAVGHLGNVYWLPDAGPKGIANPLDDKVHGIIVGLHGRINFPTANDEPTVRYVLSRIRSHSR
jgi:hypothetical protein